MIEGYVERVDAANICGWVYDPKHPALHLLVQVLLDDHKIGEARADCRRVDLARAKKGAGDHGFAVELSAPLTGDDLARVRAVVILPSGAARQLPRVQPKPQPPAKRSNTAPSTRAAATATPRRDAGPRVISLDEAQSIVLASPAFDDRHYVQQTGRPMARADAVRDYLTQGEVGGLTPHPLFAPDYAAARLRAEGVEVGDGRVLTTYLALPARDIDPHPLFDSQHFRRSLGATTAAGTCLERYIKDTAAGLATGSPNILFDREFYLDRNKVVRHSRLDPLVHYASIGWRDGQQPHPLFRPPHFRKSLLKKLPDPESDLLAFYFRNTEAWSISPHPLFDPVYFLGELARKGLSPVPGYPPLAALLLCDDDIAPIDLFDIDFYRTQITRRGITMQAHPVLHYVRHNAAEQLDPHPLFNSKHYKKKYVDVAKSKADPLVHFIDFGLAESRDPSLLFAAAEFVAARQNDMRDGTDFLRTYLRADRTAFWDTHAVFEAAMYAAHTPSCIAAGDTPLAHYGRSWAASDIWFPPWGTALQPRRGHEGSREPFDIVFVSHEMTRTGAPAILLKIVEDLVARRGVRALTLAVQGGARLDDFREWSSVIELAPVRAAGIPDVTFVAAMLESFGATARPKLAIINTACADHIANGFVAAGIPVITLVHELASAFDPRVFANIYACSAAVVYPAEFVRDEAHTLFALPIEKAAIAPQGLLDPHFGTLDRATARADLLAECALPPDSFVVLACGTLDLRKGVDVFVKVAAAVERLRQRDGGGRPVHFIWLGDGPTTRHSPSWFARQDAERSAVADRIHFLGSRSDPQPYFVACDAFVLTSRQDPFPCVVHEAMACAKPVIAFANAGGAPEALVGDAGIVVDYGDVDAMARAVWDLARDPERSRAYGERALERVRSRYVFTDYVDRLVALAEERGGAAIGPAIVRPRPATPRNRVIFAASAWEASDRTAFAEHLIGGLNARGFDAELVFTQRAIASNGFDRRPHVPTTFLPTTFREKLRYKQIWSRLHDLLERSAPAVFVGDLDDMAAALTPIVPRGIGVLGMLTDNAQDIEERVLRLGRYWQRAVLVSPAGLAVVRALSPPLAERAEVIPYGITAADPPEPRDTETLDVLCPLEGTLRSRTVSDLRTLLDRMMTPSSRFRLTLMADAPTMRVLQGALSGHLAGGGVRLVDSETARSTGALRHYDALLRVSDTAFGPALLLQAMAAGLILLESPRVDNFWPVAVDAHTGFALDVTDAGAMQARLNQLAADPALRNALRRGAFDTIRAGGFELSQVCDRYAATLERMLHDLRTGAYVTPKPLFRHPELGGLALPPSLLLHPDENGRAVKLL